MNTTFRASFERDLKKIRQAKMLEAARQALLDAEAAVKWSDVPGIKKMKDSSDAFRIRVEDYRIVEYLSKPTQSSLHACCHEAKSTASSPNRKRFECLASTFRGALIALDLACGCAA